MSQMNVLLALQPMSGGGNFGIAMKLQQRGRYL
jgi:hypothetical protein